MNIIDVEGIGPVFTAKLQEAGVQTTDDLLKMGATPAGRQELERATGISHGKIREWVNHVDLYRIEGIGSEYSDLLEEAGVDTVVELAQRVPANLAAKLAQINEQKSLVRRVPGEATVAEWVAQAKTLPRVVQY